VKSSTFDNLPPMSQEDAFRILSTPFEEIELESDYYKAVFHLAKFPGLATEKALLSLLANDSDQLCFAIARRKAIEVLANFGCIESLPLIKECLFNKDTYLIENAILALQKFKCKDILIQERVIELLEDPNQNRRVLIQFLSNMNIISSVKRLKKIITDLSSSNIEKSAAIAALYKLNGDKSYLGILKDSLFLNNQNDRQCAIQDIIDASLIDFIPDLLLSPVAPSFRLKAVNSLWPKEQMTLSGIKLVSIIDSIIKDDISSLILLHSYNFYPSNDFLFEELFETDFSRSYLALRTILSREPDELLNLIDSDRSRVKNDYGALYFVNIFFNTLTSFDFKSTELVEDVSLSCLDPKWPSFMKFKPISILSLMNLNPIKYCNLLLSWFEEENNQYWATRYAVLISLEVNLDKLTYFNPLELLNRAKLDSHKFVRLKAQDLHQNIYN